MPAGVPPAAPGEQGRDGEAWEDGGCWRLTEWPATATVADALLAYTPARLHPARVDKGAWAGARRRMHDAAARQVKLAVSSIPALAHMAGQRNRAAAGTLPLRVNRGGLQSIVLGNAD